jgi:hypothetical protein
MSVYFDSIEWLYRCSMTHDSVYYLRAAQNLLNGHGFFVEPALD